MLSLIRSYSAETIDLWLKQWGHFCLQRPPVYEKLVVTKTPICRLSHLALYFILISKTNLSLSAQKLLTPPLTLCTTTPPETSSTVARSSSFSQHSPKRPKSLHFFPPPFLPPPFPPRKPRVLTPPSPRRLGVNQQLSLPLVTASRATWVCPVTPASPWSMALWNLWVYPKETKDCRFVGKRNFSHSF